MLKRLSSDFTQLYSIHCASLFLQTRPIYISIFLPLICSSLSPSISIVLSFPLPLHSIGLYLCPSSPLLHRIILRPSLFPALFLPSHSFSLHLFISPPLSFSLYHIPLSPPYISILFPLSYSTLCSSVSIFLPIVLFSFSTSTPLSFALLILFSSLSLPLSISHCHYLILLSAPLVLFTLYPSRSLRYSSSSSCHFYPLPLYLCHSSSPSCSFHSLPLTLRYSSSPSCSFHSLALHLYHSSSPSCSFHSLPLHLYHSPSLVLSTLSSSTFFPLLYFPTLTPSRPFLH